MQQIFLINIFLKRKDNEEENVENNKEENVENNIELNIKENVEEEKC